MVRFWDRLQITTYHEVQKERIDNDPDKKEEGMQCLNTSQKETSIRIVLIP